jgi:hypothetical protein
MVWAVVRSYIRLRSHPLDHFRMTSTPASQRVIPLVLNMLNALSLNPSAYGFAEYVVSLGYPSQSAREVACEPCGGNIMISESGPSSGGINSSNPSGSLAGDEFHKHGFAKAIVLLDVLTIKREAAPFFTILRASAYLAISPLSGPRDVVQPLRRLKKKIVAAYDDP